MALTSFDCDPVSADSIRVIKPALGVRSNRSAICRAVALARLMASLVDQHGCVVLEAPDGTQTTLVMAG